MICAAIASLVGLAACTSPSSKSDLLPPSSSLPSESSSAAVLPSPSFPHHEVDVIPKTVPVPAQKSIAIRNISKVPVVGWVEKVQVEGAKLPLKAKLDTGAHTSSIDAHIIKIFKKDGDEKDWVIYRLPMNSQKEETFESPVTRWVRIKTKTGKFIRRPVVRMHVCIGSVNIDGEVNLADRTHFIYPVLIGRNMIKNHVLIDVKKTFTVSPNCRVN